MHDSEHEGLGKKSKTALLGKIQVHCTDGE